jgi:hypothetical protein
MEKSLPWSKMPFWFDMIIRMRQNASNSDRLDHIKLSYKEGLENMSRSAFWRSQDLHHVWLRDETTCIHALYAHTRLFVDKLRGNDKQARRRRRPGRKCWTNTNNRTHTNWLYVRAPSNICFWFVLQVSEEQTSEISSALICLWENIKEWSRNSMLCGSLVSLIPLDFSMCLWKNGRCRYRRQVEFDAHVGQRHVINLVMHIKR